MFRKLKCKVDRKQNLGGNSYEIRKVAKIDLSTMFSLR